MAVFTPNEIRRRWDAIRQTLGAAECAVVPSFHNSYYVSGVPCIQYGRWTITILFADYDPVIIAPASDLAVVETNSPIKELRSYRDDDGPSVQAATHLVTHSLREHGIRRVGIEAGGMPAVMYFQLKSALPDVTFIDVTEAIDDVRLASSDEELAYIREASRIADVGLETVLSLIGVDVEEGYAGARAILAMEESLRPGLQGKGAYYMQQGLRSLTPHTLERGGSILAGGILEIVIEYEVWHYQAGVERAVLVGEVTDRVERVYGAMLRAFNASRDAIRPGTTFAEVHEVARREFIDAGYEEMPMGSGLVRNILHHTGGRIDGGNLRGYNQRLLEPGMVLTIEPCAYVAGVGTPRHCDMVLVTEGGREILSGVASGILRIAAGDQPVAAMLDGG